MIKAVIFDMDGVLVDSEHHHHKSEIATFKHFGVEIDPNLNRQFKGLPLKKHFSSLIEKLNLDTSLDDLLAKQNQFLEKVFSTEASLFNNVEQVLKELSSKYKIALATSSERRFVKIVLKRFGIAKYFQVVVTANDITKGKPDPEIFLKAANLLGFKPEECVVVEDSSAGMQAAKSAGMTLIAHKVDHNKELDFSKADFIAEQFMQIPQIIEKINA